MFRAYCNRSGTIGFTGDTIPDGSLPIARHDNPSLLRGTVAALARVGYDQKTLLVPGLPEAMSGEQALDALINFTERVTTRLKADLDQTNADKERMLIPRDGDIAHRRGYRRDQNPFAPDTDLHAIWDEDWTFREASVSRRIATVPKSDLKAGVS
jgi:hypothetical protein